MNPTLKKQIIILNITVALLLAGCGRNSDNAEQINSTTTTTPVTVTPTQDTNVLKSLSLKMDKTTLNKDENTTLKVMATYVDGTGKNVTQEVEWVMTPEDSVAVNGSILTAKKDNPTTLKAKIGNTLSNTLNLNITWVVDGHVLPPEPDKTLNDSTLLGIDVNDNGVRDDVERYIIKRFAQDPKYPKIKTAIALQYAWASQKILESPTMESKKYIDDALDCQYYWAWKEMKENTQGLSKFEQGKYYSELTFLTDPILKDKIYNTRVRLTQKFSFNAALSGNIFDGRKESIDNCQINIDELGE